MVSHSIIPIRTTEIRDQLKYQTPQNDQTTTEKKKDAQCSTVTIESKINLQAHLTIHVRNILQVK